MSKNLSDILGFTGRLGRLGYGLGLIAVTVTALALILMATYAFDLTASETDGRMWEEDAANIGLIVPFYAALIALTAKRIRDIGWPVLPVLVVLAAVDLAEWFVLPRWTEQRLPAPFEMFTPLGGVLSLAAAAWLLLWPSRIGPASATRP